MTRQKPKSRTSRRTNGDTLPKPFVKWVGGKGQLVRELLARAPAEFKAYHEPFLGGAALFFALHRQGRLDGKRVCLSDVNQELVDTYVAIKQDVDKVIAALKKHQNKLWNFETEDEKREYYYAVRAQDPKRLSPPTRAARMIFLNRTGFNGLYRVNSKGKFNVPFGRYKKPKICDADNLEAVSAALENVTISSDSFDRVSKEAKKGDFVYFDPPYAPVSTTANFVSYARDGFDAGDQKRLADTFLKLGSKGVEVMLSNSDTRDIRDLYKKFRIDQVKVPRKINSKAKKRGLVNEVVVLSYTPREDD